MLDRWKNVFRVAAAWNIIAALVALADLRENARIFYGLPGPALNFGILQMLATVWVCVLLFGIGYLVVSRDPGKNHVIVWLGMAGKLFVFVAWTMAYFRGDSALIAFLGGLGDLAFAAVFAWFLLTQPFVSSQTRS